MLHLLVIQWDEDMLQGYMAISIATADLRRVACLSSPSPYTLSRVTAQPLLLRPSHCSLQCLRRAASETQMKADLAQSGEVKEVCFCFYYFEFCASHSNWICLDCSTVSSL